MTKNWTGKPALFGLGLAGTLWVAGAGCGGGKESSDAVVVPEPGAATTTTPAAKPTQALPSSPSAATPAASTTSSAPVKAEGWGTLKGQVVFAGDPPAVKTLVEQGKAPKDPDVCAKNSPIVSERLLVDGATKGVKNALVYLPRPTAINPEAKKTVAEAKIVFDQEKCTFVPHVLGMMTAMPITLKSSDPINHNVNIKLKNSPDNKLLAGGSTSTFTPSGPERTPGMVTCDIHPWMQAWWIVLDSPYFAVTDEKGYFEIKNAPAGTQKVVVWQEAVSNNGFVTAPAGEEVEIKANDSTVKEFKIDPAKLRSE
jgi:hypothetical protein